IVYSGRWSDVLKERIPYLTTLKDKLEHSHLELLPLIYQKEKELLKMIDIQSKKDDEESKIRNERFDW
ncbi:hypothetical protein, partial [Acinetobacter baumannii]